MGLRCKLGFHTKVIDGTFRIADKEDAFISRKVCTDCGWGMKEVMFGIAKAMGLDVKNVKSFKWTKHTKDCSCKTTGECNCNA